VIYSKRTERLKKPLITTPTFCYLLEKELRYNTLNASLCNIVEILSWLRVQQDLYKLFILRFWLKNAID